MRKCVTEVGFYFLIWHKETLPNFPRRTLGGYGWVGSKGIVSMAVLAGGQDWAGTVFNKSHCVHGPESGMNFLFVCFYFVIRHLECLGQLCAKPQEE